MTQLKSFFDLMNELSMKSDKKLPNLKVPVKGKKGVSKYMRKKLASTAKDDINASVQSADRKPEKYLKPDGKMGIRMVKVDKEVIKKESIDNHPKVKAARKAHAAGTWDGNVDKEGEAVVHINGKPHTVTNRYGPKKQSNPDRFKPFKKKTNEAIKHTHAVVDPAGKVAGMTSNERDAKDIARRHKGKVIKLKRPMSTKKGEMMINRPFKEAINHDDAHRDAQQYSDGSMSVKKIPSMIKKSGDKHLHLHMKSYHKEKDGQDFAKKHGYKVKNYVKTQSGTRMDIHKESLDEASMAMKKAEKLMGPTKNYQQAVDRVMKGLRISKSQAEKMVKKILGVNPKTNRIESVNEIVDPMDLRGRPKKRDPYPKSPYGMKHPLHPLNIQKRKEKEKQKKAAAKKEEVEEAKTFKYFDNRDDAHAHAKKHGGKVFVNTGKGATKVKGKPINTHVVIKKEEVDVDEALTMQQRIKKRRDMKRNKARIAIGRRRAKKKMANMKVIKKRSDRQARNAIAKKLTRGIPKRDLTPARKKEIEKRLESPALKMRIKRLSKRMFKDVRKKEVMRKKG